MNYASKKYSTGFTLIELMIAVAVIGILSAIAIPAYSSYVVRGKLVEATGELANGRIRFEQYFQDNRTYVGAEAAVCPAETDYFTYDCGTPTATTYTLTAESAVGEGLGAAGDYTYTINESNTKRTTKFNGVASTATCWQMKEGETC
ncbi:MAG: type IV pilin protein [Gallionella sp.]